jgi:hypothetical protein
MNHLKKIMGGLAALAVAGGIAVAAPAHADFVYDVCPSGRDGVVTGSATSCPFADNVRREYFDSPYMLVEAYSPVTGEVYRMDCRHNDVLSFSDGTQHTGIRCEGGRPWGSAQVVIW